MKKIRLSKKTKRILTIIGFVIMLTAIGLLAAAALRLRKIRSVADSYEGRFFEGTTINGIDVSEKTAEEAEEAIRASVEDYALEVSFREGKKESLSAGDIGYAYVSGGEVAQLLEDQDTDSLFHTLRKGGETAAGGNSTLEVKTEYDAQKLREAVLALPELQKEAMTAPSDAHMEYQDSKYVVVPETEGTTLDPEKVLEAAEDAVSRNQTALDVTQLKGVYEQPKRTMTTVGEDLQEEADELNELVPGCITYTLPHGRKMVLDGILMRTWLEEDYDGSLYRNEYSWEMHLQEYVEKMAESVNTVGITRTFAATGIGDVQVPGGNYGYEVDQEAELEKLREELSEGLTVTRDPVYSSWETSEENNGFGNSYVEIDCSRQHLWIYVDGEVKLETDVVTGLMSNPKMATPVGTCLVESKQRDTELIGQYFEYRTPVSYWMPFNGGVGMHDAWWRAEFGGNIYLWDGSNGCINMPTDKAAEAFDIVTYEMPVVVYYSEGTDPEE